MDNDYRCNCGRMLIKNVSVGGVFQGSIKCNSCKQINIISISSPPALIGETIDEKRSVEFLHLTSKNKS